jgi:hypothetical protein
MNKNIWVVVLVLLVAAAFGYIGYDKYSEYRQTKENLLLEQGAQYGYTQAIAQIAQMAVTCEQVPISVENQTINMIAVECLQQAASAE